MESVALEIIFLMVKTVKAFQLYGKAHPTFNGFFEPFYKRIIEYLQDYSELTYQIGRTSILFEDKVIYNETEKDINIAFRLFRDGIRNITFYEGLTDKEMLQYIEVISQPSKDVDIALALWECDFSHITFYVVEEDESSLGYKVPDAPVTEINYDTCLEEILKKENINLNLPLEAMLSDDELQALKLEISKEESTPQIARAINTLIDFLNIEKAQEVIDSLIGLLELCMNTNDFYDARKIVHKLQSYREVKPLSKFETETVIMGMSNLPDTLEESDFNEFIAFIGFFSRKTIPSFLRIASSIKRKERTEAMKQRIAYMCQGNAEPVMEFLASSNDQAVIIALTIIGILQAKETVDKLDHLLGHANPLVRYTLAQTLCDIGAAKKIAVLLNDPDTDVRVKVLQLLTVHPYKSIFPEIMNRFKDKNFKLLSFSEQLEIVSCLVANGDFNLAPFFKKILFKFKLFGRKNYLNMRRLAAIGLQQVGTDEAIEILNEGMKKKNRDIAAVCELVSKAR